MGMLRAGEGPLICDWSVCLGVFHIKWALFVTREGGAVSSVLTHPSGEERQSIWKYRILGYLPVHTPTLPRTTNAELNPPGAFSSSR